MKVAGLGFRRDVTINSLREAVAAVGGARGLAALATVSDKAGSAALRSLADELGLPIKAVPAEVLAGVTTSTQSELIKARFGAGSVAEAAALAAAGHGARLISPRIISRDRMAAAAIAEGDGE
jgi:cobalt-precorrin 5A hydrolase